MAGGDEVARHEARRRLEEQRLLDLWSGRAFVPPDDPGNAPRLHAGRELFVRRVHDVEPMVVGELVRECLPIYRELAAQGWLGRVEPAWDVAAIRGAREGAPLAAQRLHERLAEWSDRWRLWDDWCLEAAVATLRRDIGPFPEGGTAPLAYSHLRFYDLPVPPGTIRHWDGLESLAAFGARLDAAYREAEALAAALEADGYRRADAIRTGTAERTVQRRRTGDPAAPGTGERFFWLARWQVSRHSFATIAEDAGIVDPQTVWSAVETLASQIGLTRPGTQPRRPSS